MPFSYKFPIINNISDVLPAIEGCDDFVVADRSDYIIINYLLMAQDTFPPVVDYNSAVRREARGITFDKKTGNIIRRPYSKFFNVNEREETLEENIDLSLPHVILEKLDGSMISSFIINDEIIWATKMASEDFHLAVKKFVDDKPQYEKFARHCINIGFTPIFEWCSRENRIVLDYGEDNLILTAVRDMISGEFVSYENLQYYSEVHGIPIVRAFDPAKDINVLVEYTRGLEDLEGFVIRFDDGSMTKLKCDWYIRIHKAKDALSREYAVINAWLNNELDDLLAVLPENDKKVVNEQVTRFHDLMNGVIDRTWEVAQYALDNHIDRKTFALEVAPKYPKYVSSFIFGSWNELSLETISYAVLHHCIKNSVRNVNYEKMLEEFSK
jgi:RNA ligase